MVSLEIIALVLTGLSITASILYYTMNLRNANKTQQLALENRQAQLYMQLMNKDTSQEFQKLAYDIRHMRAPACCYIG
jgi:hypothetical protein